MRALVMPPPVTLKMQHTLSCAFRQDCNGAVL